MVEICIELAVSLAAMAFVMIIVDTALGMYYGTLLSPILVGFGFDPLVVIPSLLISQTLGDLTGTLSHHRFKNADFRGLTQDTKVTLTMVIPGALVVIVGALIAVSVPRVALKTYIGLLVLVLSLLCFRRIKYKFRWWRHIGYGTLAAFNKVITGGGFGPVTSTGGIIGGLSPRASIATTTFGELLICALSFAAHVALRGLVDPIFAVCLCAGAIMGGFIGPYVASRIDPSRLRTLVAILGVVSGIWVLTRTWF